MQLKGRKTDAWGNVIFSTDGLVDHLMRGGEITELQADKSEQISKFNEFCRIFDHPEDQVLEYREPNCSVEEWDARHQSEWFTPEPYASMNVLEWLLEKCSREDEVERVLVEWQLFEERGMEPVLRFLIYMIEHFRSRGIVWGVGRGSSVASYCLYLIGVHKVDSIKFDLDPHEFLK